ncbi:MAG TPA: hypothetical protein ACFYED_00105 [Candidatus Tripitaka californicus]|uniref:hypothetical protein n=1 Tax=Candidatus Tripitaka californicus TaxID=3367616 RepID=UPI004026D2A0
MSAEKLVLTRVRWHDSTATVGWRDVDEEFLPNDVESVGYLWDDRAEYVTLVESVQMDAEGETVAVNGTITIPRSVITEMESIGGARND